MNIFILVTAYLRSKLLNTALNIILLSLGIALITVVLLVTRQLEEKLSRNARGIDLVVGAKGSPLQIILCNVFHIDFPTGNINANEADRIAGNRLVRKAIPLALGDSYMNYRIIGTDTAYTNLYSGVLAAGQWWSKPMEVVAGDGVAAALHIKLGDEFHSAHGLTEDGHAHDERGYVIVGIMQPAGTIIDNLLFTDIASVWAVHDKLPVIDTATDSSASNKRNVLHLPATRDSTSEITSMLIKYRNPLAAIQLPRLINSQTTMQAASPAFEMARLIGIFGAGIDVLAGFAGVLIVISALSIFIALYNSLKHRRYDIAIMRSMGAGRARIFFMMILEGTTLTLSGALLGVVLGHASLQVMTMVMEDASKAGIEAWSIDAQQLLLITGSLGLGVLCSLIPAWQASRTDIHQTLAGR